MLISKSVRRGIKILRFVIYLFIIISTVSVKLKIREINR